MTALPPIPVEWTAAMPEDALQRLIAGVRSHIGQSVTEEQVARRREAEAEGEETE